MEARLLCDQWAGGGEEVCDNKDNSKVTQKGPTASASSTA